MSRALLLIVAALLVGATATLLLRRAEEPPAIVVTERGNSAARLRVPSLKQPVYYTAASTGFQHLGAGKSGEAPPAKEDVFKAIARVLAQQGYLPADGRHEPSVLLVWTWGTMHVPTAPPDDATRRFMGAHLLGGRESEPSAPAAPPPAHLRWHTAATMQLDELAGEPLHIAAIAAYDLAAMKRNERELLWMTRLTRPAKGAPLTSALPKLLALGGPWIGRETPLPLVVTPERRFDAKIQIDDPRVVEHMAKTSISVTELATR